MTRRRYAAVLACAVAGFAGPAGAQGAGPDAVDSARALVRTFAEHQGVPGLAVAVGVDTGLVWFEGFGYADLADSTPVTPRTQFRIGSISMSLTAAGVALLVEAGRLKLQANVCAYVPSYPEKRYTFTVEQLAGHLAGVRHYRDREFYSTARYETVLDGLRIFDRDTLLFEPGSRFSFSSYGWNLLSAAVESAAKQDFLTFMRTRVFEPLDLTSTRPDRVDSVMPHRARFYERAEDGRLVEAPYVDNSYKWASGGFLSSPADLVRFGLAHLRPGFLQPASVERLWTSQRTVDGVETGYGIGWSVGRDGAGRKVVSHTGSSVGGRAMLLVYPEHRVVVALAANLTGLPYRNLPQDVARLFLR